MSVVRPAALSTWCATLLACASSAHGPDGKDAPPATPSSASDAKARANAEREATLDAACGDVERFGKIAGAPAIDTARMYMARCGAKDAVALTSKLVSFPTVSAREAAKDGASFSAMLEYLKEWTKEAGLELRVSGENDAWEIGYGKGEPKIAFVMHADVVPEGEGLTTISAAAAQKPSGELPPGWSHPPFHAEIGGDRLYGRGTEDDKAPIAVVLVMMKTLAKLHFEPKGKVLAILGTGEEHDWAGMKRYVDAGPKVPYVISVDASFPVVVAENGFVAWHLAAPMKAAASKKKPKGCATAVEAKGGQFLTQVPGEATLMLTPPKGEAIDRFQARVQAASAEVAKAHGGHYRFEIIAGAEPRVAIRVLGTAVHSSVADEGHNALWAIAEVAKRVDLCDGGLAAILRVIAADFDGDHYGQKLGLAYQDDLMGRLLVAPTILRVENDEARLSINMRRPRGMTSDAFGKKLDRALEELRRAVDGSIKEVGERYVGEPALADTAGPMVSTLLDIYRADQNDPGAKAIAIRGGTYARLFPGAVSFGPALPGKPYRGHAPDEYVELEAIRVMSRVLLEATLRLDALATEPRASTEPAR